MTQVHALFVVSVALSVFVGVLSVMFIAARDKIAEQRMMLEEQSQRIDRLIKRGYSVVDHSARMASLLRIAETQLQNNELAIQHMKEREAEITRYAQTLEKTIEENG